MGDKKEVAELKEVNLRSQLLDLIIEKREHYKDLTEVGGEYVMALDYTDYGFHVNEMINNYLSNKGDSDHAQTLKVITGDRASGKTYQAIKHASENWLYILVVNRQQATEIFQMANELDLSIPYPVTVEELMRGNAKGTSLERNGIIVDNALSVLQQLLPVRVNMATVESEAESDG